MPGHSASPRPVLLATENRWQYTGLVSYHIYHTEALILSGRAVGEGDRSLFCYTRELGLVMAHAKSLRESRSRLRYALQTFSHAEIDLIRGKHGWRLISARPVRSHSELWRHASKRRILAHHAGLLERLIQGEERHEILFDDIISGLQFLERVESGAHLRAAELLLVIRLLAHLGYWEERDTYAHLLADTAWGEDSLEYVNLERPALLLGVNNALEASQL